MLKEIARGVLIHESDFVQSNAVVVLGRAGVLLIDPGVHEDELRCLARDVSDSGRSVVAGFSTHPHWDHLLWHVGLGTVPRYGTMRCAAAAREQLSGSFDASRHGIPEEVPLDLLGLISGLPENTVRIPWDGPPVRILEHRAHASGHAALLIEDRGVLVAGDMLSDVLIPMLDLDDDATDPVEDYLAALRLFDSLSGEVDVVVPGHGSVAQGGQVRTRIDQDQTYVHALRDPDHRGDARLWTAYSKAWLPAVHERQLEILARRR